MDPSHKIPSNMKSLSAKMLQISWKMGGSNSKCCNAVEMAASSSRMLQIARETDRTADPKRNPKTEKNNCQNKSGPISKMTRAFRHWLHATVLTCCSWPVTYEVVLQILNPSAGNLVYAGKGGIGACQEVGETAEPEGRSFLVWRGKRNEKSLTYEVGNSAEFRNLACACLERLSIALRFKLRHVCIGSGGLVSLQSQKLRAQAGM